MIFGVLYVDTSRKFRKNPRFWAKSIFMGPDFSKKIVKFEKNFERSKKFWRKIDVNRFQMASN